MLNSRVSFYWRAMCLTLLVVNPPSVFTLGVSDAVSESGSFPTTPFLKPESGSVEQPSEYKNKRAHYKKTSVGALDERVARMQSKSTRVPEDATVDIEKPTKLRRKDRSAHLRPRAQTKHRHHGTDSNSTVILAEGQPGVHNSSYAVDNTLGAQNVVTSKAASDTSSPRAKHTSSKKAAAVAYGKDYVSPKKMNRAENRGILRKKSLFSWQTI